MRAIPARDSHLPGEGLRNWLNARDRLGMGNRKASLGDGGIGLGCWWLLDVDCGFACGLGEIFDKDKRSSD